MSDAHNVHGFIKESKIFTFILLGEFIFVLFLIVNIFAPLNNFTVDVGESVNFFEGKEDSVRLPEQRIGAGAYTVTVAYDSEIETILNQADEVIGAVCIDSFLCPAAVYASTILLIPGYSNRSETIWIGYGAKLSDLTFTIQYNGSGTLEIKNIEVKENFIYRITRCFGFLFLFILLDIGYCLFFTNFLTRICKNPHKLGIIAGILLCSSIPIMGNTVYYGHDLDFHINRIVSLANGLSQGQFPVRIYTDMLNGYGYASPLFYSDTFLYIPAILYILKVPLGMCYQIYILVNNVFTILFSYLCFKSIFGDNEYVLLGVYVYTLAPYRLINIYTRAAVGEFTAMTFMPLVIWGLWNIYTKDKVVIRDSFPLIIGLFGIIQSHVISTVMVGVFIIFFCIIEWKKTFQKTRFWILIKAALMTLMINAAFLVPMLDSMSMDIKSKGIEGRIQHKMKWDFHWEYLFALD